MKIKTDAFKALKKTLQAGVAKANKRLTRLEGNDMQGQPAYKEFQQMKGDEEGTRFTSAGDNYRELQKEQARVDKFLRAKTSLVRGANKNMKDIAERTGIKYNKVGELPKKTARFFELSSRVGQYLKNVEGSYEAVGYREVWEQVSEYVQASGVDLNADDFDIEQHLDELIESTSQDKELQQTYEDKDTEWFDI